MEELTKELPEELTEELTGAAGAGSLRAAEAAKQEMDAAQC